MKSVMLHVNEDAGQEARLLAALALVRQHGARPTCIQVTPMLDFVVTDPFGGMYEVATLFEHLAKEAVKARTRSEARLANEGVEWEWSIHNGDVAGTIVQRSQLADLIVLSQADSARGAQSHPLALVADVAVHARAPVLAVPITGPTFDPSGVAVVAWNGAPEAAHAVRAALPMLQQASAVHVITLDENEGFPMDDVRRYLKIHGITAECTEHRLDGKQVGEALCLAAAQHKAAYLVMGAYGHSRFREAVLGGVSRYMLAHSTVPLLLAH